jgi:hypothetical protein
MVKFIYNIFSCVLFIYFDHINNAHCYIAFPWKKEFRLKLVNIEETLDWESIPTYWKLCLCHLTHYFQFLIKCLVTCRITSLCSGFFFHSKALTVIAKTFQIFCWHFKVMFSYYFEIENLRFCIDFKISMSVFKIDV